ncbi:MAG: hypothetical protein HUU20_14285 [Pirellulales bacterium]|nr:hypothetical protein [Pirellulales bacterium]
MHLDPCNLINSPRRFFGSTELLDECFDKLGPWIVSCHARSLTAPARRATGSPG